MVALLAVAVAAAKAAVVTDVLRQGGVVVVDDDDVGVALRKPRVKLLFILARVPQFKKPLRSMAETCAT